MRRLLHVLLLLRFAFADFNYNDYKYGEYTLVVLPRQTECVYMDVTAEDKSFEVVYQVVEGGELDINMYIYRPDHSVQESDSRKMEGGATVIVQQTGEYRICFDNTYSMVTKKVVYFEIFPSSDDQDYSDEAPAATQRADAPKQHVSESGNQATDAKVDTPDGEKAPELDDKDDDASRDDSPDSVTKHVAKGLVRVNKYLTFVVQTLNYYKNLEARDRNVGEANFERVNSFSILEIFIIIAVAIVQVVIVRAMLDPKSRLRQLVNKLLAKH